MLSSRGLKLCWQVRGGGTLAAFKEAPRYVDFRSFIILFFCSLFILFLDSWWVLFA